MNKPLWEVGDLVQIRLDDFRAELGLAIVLKVHTAAGDGIHYLVSEGEPQKVKWLRETYIQPAKIKTKI